MKWNGAYDIFFSRFPIRQIAIEAYETRGNPDATEQSIAGIFPGEIAGGGKDVTPNGEMIDKAPSIVRESAAEGSFMIVATVIEPIEQERIVSRWIKEVS